MATIKVDPLNKSSIEAAIGEIRELKNKIGLIANEIVSDLTIMGRDYAKANVPDAGDNTPVIGYTLGDNGIGVITATGKEAVFIEFGTGVIGRDSPHPSDEWREHATDLTGGEYTGYLTGKRIFVTKDGRIGWIYKGNDGELHFTQGIPSHPFMYGTLRYLRRQVKNVKKRVMEKYG